MPGISKRRGNSDRGRQYRAVWQTFVPDDAARRRYFDCGFRLTLQRDDGCVDGFAGGALLGTRNCREQIDALYGGRARALIAANPPEAGKKSDSKGDSSSHLSPQCPKQHGGIERGQIPGDQERPEAARLAAVAQQHIEREHQGNRRAKCGGRLSFP
jgi:hypothetical protein